MRKNISKSFISVIIILIVVIILFSPLKIPYTINVPGKIVPLKEWILIRSQDGILSSSIFNNILDFAESYGNTQADRGDQTSFRFHPDMVSRESVSVGDTIGFVYSFDVEFKWAQLKGELGTEQATLKLYESGEKESLVREARFRLDYARKQAEQQRREIERLKSLQDKSMIPPADWEREQTKLQLYEIQVNTAEASLNSVETGLKKEQIDLVRSRIHALQEEIYVMEKRMRFSTILTPLSGRLVRFAGSDTLAIVQDTSHYVVLMPVKWKDRHNLRLHKNVSIKVDGLNIQPTGMIEHVSNNVFVINGSHIMSAAAVVEDSIHDLAPGLIAQCSINCQPVRLYEYLLMYFRQ